MATGTTGYNLNHLQAAAKGASPVYKDINYATTFEATIDQTQDKLAADGKKAVTAFSAADGGGSIGFASADLSVIALLSGGTFSTTGTAGTMINRMDVLGNVTPPATILSGWIPNVDGNTTSAGLRITLPNAQVSMPSTSYAQESWTEFNADLSYVADENDVMLIWEELFTAPTMTLGVMPVNLTPPA